MNLKLNVAGVSNIGKIRTNNEDNFYFDGEIMPMYNNGTKEILFKELDNNRPICFAVFDGMGGESKGDSGRYSTPVKTLDGITSVAKPFSPLGWLNDQFYMLFNK